MKVSPRLAFISFLPILLLCGFTHPYFISITQIEHNSEEKLIEIAVKIYTDDLERAIEAQGTDRLFLGTEKEHPDTDRYISTYISQHSSFHINETELAPHFLGKEAELDVVWCYLEIPNIDKVEKIKVESRILLELEESQKNIVHIKVNNKRRSLLLHRNEIAGEISF
ncbi:MAG: DUF6702 family protein [Bacteroidota bacterium]